MRLLTVAISLFTTTHIGALATATGAPRWGDFTLKGWWNPDSTGPEPATVLKGYDYIVVGSGPGGAPLAARLGLAGYKVLVIEAGIDAVPGDWNTTVPYFNGKASEDPNIAWEFFVNHYPDLEQAARDPKYYYQLPNGTMYKGLDPPQGAVPKGTFYPRSAAVGGCVNHNALIMLNPLPDDWNQIANLTGDKSWQAGKMQKYYERLENCQYLAKGTPGHGFDGWLYTNRADESIFLSDSKVYWMLKAAASLTGQAITSVTDMVSFLRRDINIKSAQYASEHGIYNTPLIMDQHGRRSSPRDFLVNTVAQLQNSKAKKAGRIDVRTNCLATRVVFAPNTTRAIGVEFLDGQSLYRADPRAAGKNTSGSPGIAFARKEIIIAGGAYNTPQLLKLSGVGPSSELSSFSIPTLVDLPGVGRNLQDRYENSVVAEVSTPWTVFSGCTSGVNASDPCLVSFNEMGSNMSKYATNGRPVLLPMRSSVAMNPSNDLIVTGRPGYFAGYFFGYSTIGGKYPTAWSWPVLKAHTQNRAGTVDLVSGNPLDVPNITFNYFGSGTGNWQYDLSATVEGLQFARRVLRKYAKLTGTPVTELLPGPQYSTVAQLSQYVQDTSWGHHASCSCPIGADGDEMAVLDSRFRVRGTEGLRVVDASVFPRIPGFYIQTSVYMVSEKAADVIGEDAKTIEPSVVP